VVGTAVGCIVSVAVGAAVGVGVPAGGLTHPRKTDNKIIRSIEVNFVFFILTSFKIPLLINNLIDFMSLIVIREVYYQWLTSDLTCVTAKKKR